jgi:hypothetical protein
MAATLTESSPGLARRIRRKRLWGIGVWTFVGLAIGIPEMAAAAGGGWPTISNTVGHLEHLWSPVKIIVVTMIALTVAHFLRFPPHHQGGYGPDASGRSTRPGRWGRSSDGRLMRIDDSEAAFDQDRELDHSVAYFVIAIVVVVGGSLLAFLLSSDMYVRAYVMYGLIAVAFLLIPNALAWICAKEVPYPTAVRTVDLLGKWRHPIELTLFAGLVVLAIHLTAYPWP